MIRIPVAQPRLSGNERNYVLDCLDSSWISSAGAYIPAFESAFARFCGVKHSIAVSNGTAALHLALAALGVSAGDEVIVPTVTYVATANAVRYCGATPVLVDVVSPTLNIDPADIERRLTPRTRGIIPVHLYGHPADMAAINAIAKRHSLFVLEDAAEAHGARWLGRSVGSLGTCAAFSFFGNKIVTTGEGGMVTTDDDELAAKLRLLRGQGMDSARRYWFPVIGYNYRLTNLQAAIGLAQMETVESALAARSRLVDRYDQALAPLSRSLVLPRAGRQVAPVCWLYTVFLRNGDGRRRDAVMRLLDEAGIETRPTFHPLHTLPPHQDGRSFPVAEVWAPRGISLPTHEHINTADIERITDALELALDATSALVGRNRTRTTRMVEAEPADGMRRQTSSAPTT